MIKTVKKITQAVDFVARLVSIFFVLCVLVFMTSQVFFRYVLNSSLQWSEEASIWAMIWMVFIGSVVVVRRWEHIYIPTVVKLLPIKIRSLVIVFTKILVLIFFAVHCTMVPLSTRMLLWSKFSMYFGQLLQEHIIQN